MDNLEFYYKYIIRPQFLLKFPKLKNSFELTTFRIRKIRLSMFLLDPKKNYYLYLYNICVLVRLMFNKQLFIYKVKKNFTLNKIHIRLSIENFQIYMFLDVFSTCLIPLFESFNMGLQERDFDIFGNYYFEFNYCDPIFMSKNTIII